MGEGKDWDEDRVMEVNFSKQGTGKCPECKKFKTCFILSKLRAAANQAVPRKYDYLMELVVYKCPEFEDK
jgi:hypothetical protein